MAVIDKLDMSPLNPGEYVWVNGDSYQGWGKVDFVFWPEKPEDFSGELHYLYSYRLPFPQVGVVCAHCEGIRFEGKEIDTKLKRMTEEEVRANTNPEIEACMQKIRKAGKSYQIFYQTGSL